MLRIPKYLVAENSPDEPHSWIIRARNPFVIAEVEERGMIGLRLHCWPPTAPTQTTEHKLTNILHRMAEIWCAEVDWMEGLPDSWDWIFDDKKEPPEWMVCQGVSRFIGVLHVTSPRFMVEVSEQTDGIVGFQILEKNVGALEEEWLQAAEIFYKNFCAREDEIIESEEDEA